MLVFAKKSIKNFGLGILTVSRIAPITLCLGWEYAPNRLRLKYFWKLNFCLFLQQEEELEAELQPKVRLKHLRRQRGVLVAGNHKQNKNRYILL